MQIDITSIPFFGQDVWDPQLCLSMAQHHVRDSDSIYPNPYLFVYVHALIGTIESDIIGQMGKQLQTNINDTIGHNRSICVLCLADDKLCHS